MKDGDIHYLVNFNVHNGKVMYENSSWFDYYGF